MALAILSSCTQVDDTMEALQSTAIDEVKMESPLKLQSIDELENITLGQIPGAEKYKGWQLQAITYNCTDTIEHRALLMDVEATLVSNEKHTTTLKFKTEVGPELVSVEYYPMVEVRAAHDNMSHCPYPRVERYRNYSDGSRIGPDLFYDYGHGVMLTAHSYSNFQTIIWLKTCDRSINDWDIDKPQFVENGKLAENRSWKFGYFNTNAVFYDQKGNCYKGEDFFPTEYCTRMVGSDEKPTNLPLYEDFKNNFYGTWGEYGTPYSLSRDFNINEATAEWANLCKDVPIAPNAPQFGEDTQNLAPGFYFARLWFVDETLHGFTNRFLKEYIYSKDDPMDLGISGKMQLYSQYLIVDGRLIHFNDVCDLKVVETRHEITKGQDYINLRLETDFQMYGTCFMAQSDMTLYKKDGPKVVLYDESSSESLTENDKAELENAKSRVPKMLAEPSSDNNGLMPRPDGKSVVMDNTLPSSVKSLPKRRTVKAIKL